jgi:hypothetical protein
MKKAHMFIMLVLAIAAVASAITLIFVYWDRICMLLDSCRDRTADTVARCCCGLKKESSLFEDVDAAE